MKRLVFVALTCQRFVFARTVASLIGTFQQSKDFDYKFYMEMGCEIASSRNRAVAAAKEAGASHLLFVDYDMCFPPDAVSKLLASDKDVIGADYNMRKDPPKSTAIPVDPDVIKDAPFECQALGTGLMLIKMSVFDKYPSPWFLFGYDDKGELRFGEDTYFCQRAKQAGCTVFADPTLGTKHIGEQLF